MSAFETQVLSMLSSIQGRLQKLEEKVFDAPNAVHRGSIKGKELQVGRGRTRSGSVDSDLNMPWNAPSLPPSGAQSVATASTAHLPGASPPKTRKESTGDRIRLDSTGSVSTRVKNSLQ